MTTRRRAALAVLVATLATLAVGHAGTSVARAAPVPLRLISQANGFNVPTDGTIVLILEVPSSLPLAALAEPDIIVTAYSEITTRFGVLTALEGALPRALDTVDLALDAVVRPAPQQLLITVPTESTQRTEPALQLPRAGIYPLVVDIRDGGEVVAELMTFVHRLPGPDEAPLAALNLAIAVGTNTDAAVDASGRATIDAAGLAELAALADLLEAVKVVVTVRVPPLALAAAQRADPALAARLTRVLAAHDVVADPLLPLDPSSAAAAGQQILYTQWLRDGETALDEQSIRNRRTVSFVDRPLSSSGGTLFRDLGSRLLLVTTDVYDPLEGSYGIFTDSSQLVRVELTDGAEIAAAIADRSSAATLAGTADPQLSAVHLMAELLTTGRQVADLGGDPRRHSVVLAAPGLGVPDRSVTVALTSLATVTPGIEPVTLDDVGNRTDVLLVDGREVTVRLPDAAGSDIAQRVATAGTLRFDAGVTGSMLPATDARIAGWERRISILPSSAVAEADVADVAAALHAEMAAIRSAVEAPQPFAFTLTGRESAIRLRFRNASDTPLTIRIRMSSAKLVFPDGDQLAVLAPDSVTEVDVSVEARTNGRFPVALQVLAPGGDVEIVPAVPLTARVNALTGLGNLITGAAVLVLLAWWGRHLGRSRRRRLASHVAGRHPVNGGARHDDTPLSPDAEASTLRTS